MQTLSELKKHCAEMSALHPGLKSTIWGYYHLAVSEISEGETESEEVAKALVDIADEIADFLNPPQPKPDPLIEKEKEVCIYIVTSVTKEQKAWKYPPINEKLETGAFVPAEISIAEIASDFLKRNPSFSEEEIAVRYSTAYSPICKKISVSKQIISDFRQVY